MSMQRVPAQKFKARCLTLVGEVCKTREPVLITKRGKPMAKLVPADDMTRDFIGRLEGVVRIVGDIESPIEPPEALRSLC